MREVLPEIEQWLSSGERIALARVISVVGSAPRGVGATLALNRRGSVSGSVSGGCVEPAVIEEGLRAIRSGEPSLLTFGISEEENLEQIGLSCGGEIRVFVERFEPSEEMSALLQALKDERPAVMASVVSAGATGLHSLPVGARLVLLYRPEGEAIISDGLGESPLGKGILADAREALQQGTSSLRIYHQPDAPADSGVEVFFDVIRAPERLVIIGAGHISIALTRLAKVLGYHVVVVDAREAFATRERFPEADDVLIAWPDDALADLAIGPSTAVAVLTHDDKFDVPALAAALRSPAGYVGAIGSRSTRQQREDRLRAAGVTDAEISRIHGPIGLAIGARTPEEIALSILAQIVADRRRSGLAEPATPIA